MRVTAGPFVDFVGALQENESGSERGRLFGRETTIEVPRTQVKSI